MARAQEKTEGYNGWTNYETWCVALWIDNDPGTYNHRYQMARESRHTAKLESEDHRDGICKVSQCRTQGTPESCPYAREARGHLADALKDWVSDEILPDLGASMAADLLGAAMSEVNWHEIAEKYLDDIDKSETESETEEVEE